MAIGQNQNEANTRLCEWQNCRKDGKYRIQTSAFKDDIHYFCQLHARLFDMSVSADGDFVGGPNPNWNGGTTSTRGPSTGLNRNFRLKHISPNYSMNYTREDILNLRTLGLETGAKQEDIKKAYKRLVKHCHPDHNPELEDATTIFTRITEAYMALKNKDFK